MSKLVVLNLGKGDLHKGFPDVTVQLGLINDPRAMEFRGSLPPAPEISQLYRNWQILYSALYRYYGWWTRLEVEDNDITNFSELEFNDLCQQLSSRINIWLNCEQFRKIDQKLRTQLNPNEEICFVIATSDKLLRRLPWHLWNFFEDYPNAEVALSPLEPQRLNKIYTQEKKVKILAIFGNNQGIDISKDKYLLEKLSNQAQINFLIEPQLKELSNELWGKGWNILFFAGHSSSQERGVLQINQTTTITLDKLKYGLKKAIESGLHLAIFNSCDGLGLAEALEDLHIPQVIVMREPIPDLIAQEFLKHFLGEFSSGQSLYSALREARKRLEGIEDKYPCATWLPVICQNPLSAPMIWQSHRKMLTTKSVLVILLTSLLITSLVMGVRYGGYLQTSELQAFDHFMQLRSHFVTEKPDERILIITVDEADIQYQLNKGMQMRWSLSDQALALLLDKLNKYQPRTIGLDIYRDGSVDPKYSKLATRFQKDNRLFFVCKVPTTGDDGDSDGIPPPSGVSIERLSFSDFVADEDDLARRQLLNLTPPPTSPCSTEDAFNLKLALHYLKKEGKTSSVTKSGYLQIGDIVFQQLNEHTSGYQKVDASGYQILLNYRSLDSVEKIAEQVSLRDVLNEKISLETVQSLKDRIILIGLSALTNTNDYWKTPFSSNAKPKQKQTPGVFVQAQMLSQILSAVLDNRPLLWWWSGWVEALWIWGWSLVGGITAWYYSKPLHLGLAVIVTLLTVFGLCFGIFALAGWVPFIPSVLALLATQVMVISWFRRLHIHKRK
ncbi:MAG: CHASE2 domain-containing protein [Nostoc sp. DedQUE08]|uniref:CHASE2 domain-containing protein n=1 Tax=unclassified Nostoc TaxID=2593658 RepID=UPI002AD50B7D|nr:MULTISPECIES: CHASE2 domain-containing protein [unclassified Nostoc]MDZ8030419.1 CHASE2 domain-containing protein [Nostoc sp. DedSLP04]MDZ8064381.1 CHASE2 domain-containing protein [Nostoc sp. DedQUE08]MDZ8092358.1 CHASE2 domain-containing protein [Nostoc sp. DedQUE05]